jgi:transposase
MLLVAKLNQMLFGRKSEKVLRQIEQLEFQLEDPTGCKRCRRGSDNSSRRAVRNGDAALPALAGAPSAQSLHPHAGSLRCPDCGGRLRKLGKDVAEMLEYVRAASRFCATCGRS